MMRMMRFYGAPTPPSLSLIFYILITEINYHIPKKKLLRGKKQLKNTEPNNSNGNRC